MPIELALLSEGEGLPLPRFRIYVLGDGGSFPVVDFLDSLEASNPDSHQRLIAMLDRYAQNGPPINDFRKCRCIHKGGKIFEFKRPDKSRITWFYDDNTRGMIVCTNGFPKPNPKRLQQDINTAIAWKKRYEAARSLNQVVIITE